MKHPNRCVTDRLTDRLTDKHKLHLFIIEKKFGLCGAPSLGLFWPCSVHVPPNNRLAAGRSKVVVHSGFRPTQLQCEKKKKNSNSKKVLRYLWNKELRFYSLFLFRLKCFFAGCAQEKTTSQIIVVSSCFHKVDQRSKDVEGWFLRGNKGDLPRSHLDLHLWQKKQQNKKMKKNK